MEKELDLALKITDIQSYGHLKTSWGSSEIMCVSLSHTLLCWHPNIQWDGVTKQNLGQGLGHRGNIFISGYCPYKSFPRELPCTFHWSTGRRWLSTNQEASSLKLNVLLSELWEMFMFKSKHLQHSLTIAQANSGLLAPRSDGFVLT